MKKIKIAMYDLEGHLLEVFNDDTVRDLERELKYNQGSISNCVDKNIMSTNNRQFRKFAEKSKVQNRIGDISDITRVHLKPVHKYFNGKYICTYESSKIASQKNGIEDSSINKCCNGVYKSAGGFDWKYADENKIESFIEELKSKIVPTMGVLIELDKLKDKYTK